MKRIWRASLWWNLTRFGLTPEKLVQRAARQFAPEGERIFLTCAPKSGTHLVERVLGLHPQLRRHMTRKLHSGNITRYGGWRAQMDRCKPDCFILAHAEHSAALATAIHESSFKTIVMLRDPRAIIASQAHYILVNKQHEFHKFVAHGTLDDAVKFTLFSRAGWDQRTFLESTLGYVGWADEPNTLVVKFEDLADTVLANRAEAVERILRHVGATTAGQISARIASKIVSSSSQTFRRGSTDGWRSEISHHHAAEISRLFQHYMARFGYRD